MTQHAILPSRNEDYGFFRTLTVCPQRDRRSAEVWTLASRLIAEAIHANSARKGRKFLPINCAALPEPLLESEMFGHVKGAFTGATTHKEGLFESADGGTIFLDEIGSMPPGIQAKLLRVLQDRQVRRVGGNDSIAVNVRAGPAAPSNSPAMTRRLPHWSARSTRRR